MNRSRIGIAALKVQHVRSNCLQSLAFASIVLMGVTSQAQEVPAGGAWRSSDWALQFQLNPNFDLGAYGGGIAVKRHLGERSAVRVGVDVTVATSDVDQEARVFLPVADLATADSDADIQRYNVFLQLLRSAAVASRTSLYWGGGVVQSFQREHAETINRPSSAPATLSERDGHTWSAGLQALLGVEWFAARDLALDAEFGITASYRWGEGEVTRTENNVLQATSSDTFHSWNVGAADAVLGVTF
jgi:opacity protein-like surface antigen